MMPAFRQSREATATCGDLAVQAHSYNRGSKSEAYIYVCVKAAESRAFFGGFPVILYQAILLSFLFYLMEQIWRKKHDIITLVTAL